jgi:hypothetical protein
MADSKQNVLYSILDFLVFPASEPIAEPVTQVRPRQLTD